MLLILEQLFSEALSLSPNAVGYYVSQRLAELFPDKAILQTTDSDFGVEAYAQVGLCTLTPRLFPHGETEIYWDVTEKRITEDAKNVWWEVAWQGYSLDVIELRWNDNLCHWLIADIKEVAENFFVAVCEWEQEIRDEVLVFENGWWRKDEDLYKAIKSATFDNLILQGSLKNDIRTDIERFLASREIYETHGIPWKRGIIFIGPPGNGKTHAVKALINALHTPCLYVKSLKGHGGEEYNIQKVFARARETTPCVVVMEDLDSLITPHNRSFFLNEMDGFAQNAGIVVIATTNHPEKLDPALVNRPSRFDRKYHFALPAQAERAAYIRMWSATVKEALRLDDAGIERIAVLADGFSFAYLKELFVSAMMGWIANPTDAMVEVMAAQVALLREQMATAQPDAPPEAMARDDD